MFLLLQQLLHRKQSRAQDVHLQRHRGQGEGHGWRTDLRGGSYRAQRAVLHIVHGELHLRVLAEEGILEKGNAAEVRGVAAALWTNHNTSKISNKEHHLYARVPGQQR